MRKLFIFLFILTPMLSFAAEDQAEFKACISIDDSNTTEIKSVPADIIIAIDSSGSMGQEIEQVQANLNEFSKNIKASNVDANVILIASGGFSICIKPPLGSGTCPDDHNPDGNYYRVPFKVSSTDAFKVIKCSYDGKNCYHRTRTGKDRFWKEFRRKNAIVHFIVISDDGSNSGADKFKSDMLIKDESMTDFYFHAIASQDSRYSKGSCNKTSAREGYTYKDFTQSTSGVFGNLCNQEFKQVFDAVAQQVKISSLTCEWNRPDIPVGMGINTNKTFFKLSSGEDQILPEYISSELDCQSVNNGWYFEKSSDETKIVLCPNSCQWLNEKESSKVEIKIGCSNIEVEE